MILHVNSGKFFYSLVKPSTKFEITAIAISGIDASMVTSSPTTKIVLQKIIDFIKETSLIDDGIINKTPIIIAHNGDNFDFKLLKQLMDFHNLKFEIEPEYLDSLKFFRNISKLHIDWPRSTSNRKSNAQENLYKWKFGSELSFHCAFYDVWALFRLLRSFGFNWNEPNQVNPSLVICKCKKGDCKGCSCHKNDKLCSAACGCQDNCKNRPIEEEEREDEFGEGEVEEEVNDVEFDEVDQIREKRVEEVNYVELDEVDEDEVYQIREKREVNDVELDEVEGVEEVVCELLGVREEDDDEVDDDEVYQIREKRDEEEDNDVELDEVDGVEKGKEEEEDEKKRKKKKTILKKIQKKKLKNNNQTKNN